MVNNMEEEFMWVAMELNKKDNGLMEKMWVGLELESENISKILIQIFYIFSICIRIICLKN